jgi:hypothetical protein
VELSGDRTSADLLFFIQDAISAITTGLCYCRLELKNFCRSYAAIPSSRTSVRLGAGEDLARRLVICEEKAARKNLEGSIVTLPAAKSKLFESGSLSDL